MGQQMGLGEDLIASHMIDMMMGIQHGFDMPTSPRNLIRHMHGHGWKGHGINHQRSLLLDNKAGICYADFSLPVNDGEDAIGYFLDLLYRPLAHADCSWASAKTRSTSSVSSPTVIHCLTSPLGSFVPSAFAITRPSSTSSSESMARSL